MQSISIDCDRYRDKRKIFTDITPNTSDKKNSQLQKKN